MSCRQYVVKTSNIIVTTYFRPSVMMMAARNTLTVGGAHTDACYRRACAQCGRISRAAGARNSTPSTLNMTLPTFAADRRRLQHGAPTYLHTRRSPANPPAVAAVDRRDRQTDGHPTVTKTLLYLLCEQRQWLSSVVGNSTRQHYCSIIAAWVSILTRRRNLRKSAWTMSKTSD